MNVAVAGPAPTTHRLETPMSDPSTTNSDLDEEEDEVLDDIIRAKWSIDGATTLEEAAGQLEAFATRLRQAHGDGFLLRGPIDDDYGFVYHPDGRHLYEQDLT